MTEEKVSYAGSAPATQPREIRDGRDDIPIFVHSELDDLELSLEAFRVYCHLARRAGKNGMAFPSYQSIGDKCFRKNYPKANADTIRRKAIAAVRELAELGLITKIAKRKEDGSNATNDYMLTPKSQWGVVSTHYRVSTHPGGVNAPHGVNAPKDTPIEGSPIEGSPIKDLVASPPLPAAKASPPKAESKKGKGETSFVQEMLGLEGTDSAEPSPPRCDDPPPPAKPLTPQQEMFGALCEALGWDYHVITDDDKKRISQAGRILREAGYIVKDIRDYMLDVWFNDWRWQKHKQRPTLEQLRQGIGNMKAVIPETIANNANSGMLDKNQAAADRVRAMFIAQGKEHLLR